MEGYRNGGLQGDKGKERQRGGSEVRSLMEKVRVEGGCRIEGSQVEVLGGGGGGGRGRG